MEIGAVLQNGGGGQGADAGLGDADCDLLRRPAAHIGSTARYDWDGMYIALMVRIHDQGLPATQADWLGEVQEWFVVHGDGGEVPDERTIRRRLTPIWKALRGSS